jgi:hypothetical protein
MITIKAKLWLVAITAASIILPTALRAQTINVEVGDRPYYTHGPHYWVQDYEMIWVPGHWDEHHYWVHGLYRRAQHRHHRDDDQH